MRRAILSALLAMVFGVVTASSTFAGPAKYVTFTITTTTMQAEAQAAAVAWSKNTVAEVLVGDCSGLRCIRLERVPVTICEFGVGCSDRHEDGSCDAQANEILDVYGVGSVVAVVEHEVGHCMGLPHTIGDPNSIMAADMDYRDPPRGPSSRDKKLLAAIYAPQPAGPTVGLSRTTTL